MTDLPTWLDAPVDDVGQRLLGCELVRELDGEELRVRIVETEAYDQSDPASHTFRGRTARNDAMFTSAGHMYVYLIHGIHYCCNVVTGREGYGSGVLIRAAEPLEGEAIMVARRSTTGVNITNGPGKLCQALGIDRGLSGHDLSRPPVQLVERPAVASDRIGVSARIGVKQAQEVQRRFFIRDDPYVSKGNFWKPEVQGE